MTWLESLTPRHIQDLVPYSSARREATSGRVWLNANENPYDRSEERQQSPLNRYPDFQPASIISSYARYAGVNEDRLLVTRGIDEGIDLLTRSFCIPGRDQVIFTPPTYGMYKISAETNGVITRAVPLQADWQLDMTSMLNAINESKLIYLCSPNNPTGNTLKRENIQTVLEAAVERSLVVVDEAYIEFKPEESVVDLLGKYPNLIVMRTLSKGFGLAGLRCGFLMASPEIIATLKKVSAPYPIPAPVVDLVSTALTEAGILQMQADVGSIQKDRQQLEQHLKQFSVVKTVYISAANFILFQVDDASRLMSFLSASGIIIRDQSAQVGLENTLRVTVGTEMELQQFYTAMEEYEEQL